MRNKVEKINKILEKIRPYIQMHSGDVSLIKFEENVVTLKITGACTHCSLADLTYNKMIGSLLREEIPDIKEIILVK